MTTYCSTFNHHDSHCMSYKSSHLIDIFLTFQFKYKLCYLKIISRSTACTTLKIQRKNFFVSAAKKKLNCIFLFYMSIKNLHYQNKLERVVYICDSFDEWFNPETSSFDTLRSVCKWNCKKEPNIDKLNVGTWK